MRNETKILLQKALTFEIIKDLLDKKTKKANAVFAAGKKNKASLKSFIISYTIFQSLIFIIYKIFSDFDKEIKMGCLTSNAKNCLKVRKHYDDTPAPEILLWVLSLILLIRSVPRLSINYNDFFERPKKVDLTFSDIVSLISEKISVTTDHLPICIITQNVMTEPCEIEKLINGEWKKVGDNKFYDRSKLMTWLEKNNIIPHANIAFNKNDFRIVTSEEAAKETESFMRALLEDYRTSLSSGLKM